MRNAYFLSVLKRYFILRRVGWMACPYCGEDEVFRSRREPLTVPDRVCGLFLLQLVRCFTCEERHYRPIFFPAPEYRGRVLQIEPVHKGKHEEKHERTA